MATKSSKTTPRIERAEAILGKSEYGNEQPTMVVGIRTSDWVHGPRLAHAVGLRAAAEIEEALAEASDTGWLVNAPSWGDEQRLPDGWRTTFTIHLEACRGAKAEVAMAALTGVADALRAGKAVRR